MDLEFEEDDELDSDEALALPISGAISVARAAPPGALHPSVGSVGHATGNCKRCCFFVRNRCANGYDCAFCHYEHERRKRKNKKKTTTAKQVASQSAIPPAIALSAPGIFAAAAPRSPG